jgi:hypothetical protein
MINYNQGFALLITRNENEQFQRQVLLATLAGTGMYAESDLDAAVEDLYGKTLLTNKDTFVNSKGYNQPVVNIMGIARKSGKYKSLLDVSIGEITKAPELMQRTGNIDPSNGEEIINYRHAVGTVGIDAKTLVGKRKYKEAALESLKEYNKMAYHVPLKGESTRFDLSESIELPDGEKFRTRGLGLSPDEHSAICIIVCAPVEGIVDEWRPIMGIGLFNVTVPDRGGEGTIKAVTGDVASKYVEGLEDEEYEEPKEEIKSSSPAVAPEYLSNSETETKEEKKEEKKETSSQSQANKIRNRAVPHKL